jgi:hypothetical protein
MPHQHDRRRNRSERPIEALGLLLESTVERYSLRSAFLASEDGLLLALAGDSEESDTFAAYAPLLASNGDDSHLRQVLQQESSKSVLYEVNPCQTPNQQVYLVTLGDESSQLTQACAHGSSGTERILAA